MVQRKINERAEKRNYAALVPHEQAKAAAEKEKAAKRAHYAQSDDE
jgi:hypothetical protein